ncbi:MAG: hypothetical protein OXP71_01540 [Candidatus Poribacteria bacterium]|nr:hypothetical protein [Candidatus Poribacteria bacterium]
MASGNGTSLAKIESNRRNAQKSTGPKTQAGKEKSKMNAIKHGLVAQATVIPVGEAKESDSEFTQLLDRVIAEFEPQGFIEEILAERIAICYWRLRRAAYAEVGEIRKALDTAKGETSEEDLSRLLIATSKYRGYLHRPEMLAELQSTEAGLDFLIEFLNDARTEFEKSGYICNETQIKLSNYFGYNYDAAKHADYDFLSYNESDIEDENLEVEVNETVLFRMLVEQTERLSAKKALLEENRKLQHEVDVIRSAIPLDVNRITRYEAAIERQLYKALDKLEDLQRARKAQSLN